MSCPVLPVGHKHDFQETYYGWTCSQCGLFYAFGTAPFEVNARRIFIGVHGEELKGTDSGAAHLQILRQFVQQFPNCHLALVECVQPVLARMARGFRFRPAYPGSFRFLRIDNDALSLTQMPVSRGTQDVIRGDSAGHVCGNLFFARISWHLSN